MERVERAPGALAAPRAAPMVQRSVTRRSPTPTIEVLTQVRRAKTEAKRSQRVPVETVVVTAPDSLHAAIEAGRNDLVDAGSIRDLQVVSGDALSTAVTLADDD